MAMERILANGVSQILNKLAPVVAREISLAWGVKDELKKLQTTLEMILAVIDDAERRQEKEEAVRIWLRSLKDVAFDADDVIDDFSYETLRRRERGNHLKNKLLDFIWFSNNPLGFSFKMAGKVRKINRRLNEITETMHKFQLQTAPVNNTSMVHDESSEQQRRRQTASVIIDSEIVGRKDDKNKIIDLITKPTTSASSSDINQSSEKVSIISIVGMGGLGKTTLAQLVYNDELVNKHFDQRIWVCVSTHFDVENILIKIMESITLAKFDSVSSFDLLAKKVQEKLQGKKFLLVLDDLWNQNLMQWERLQHSFIVGAQGSKILITTRNIQVANVVKGSNRPYQLKKLQEDECWSIIEKRAFSPGGALKTPSMINIGKEIANMCRGLPLAAKFLGSLMHSKSEEKDWLSIKENGIWNTQEGQSEIRPILKLSYDNLSPHLKLCFSYCTIFPKGWEIRRETLIHLWMAEGFLEPSSHTVGNERSMEEIGEECFDSLVWSSFLDVVKKNDSDDIITWKMHDLVHDLGRDVVGNRECAIANISELESITSDIRRLQLISDDGLSAGRCSKALSELKKLRTVFIHFRPNNNMKGCTFSSNKNLRVLEFVSTGKGCGPTTTYPAANKLRHLRYLCLANLNFKDMMHDLSIRKLYNLQTLILGGCSYVHNLLENMGSLKNLRFLDFSFSDIKELPGSVTTLSNLQRLDVSHCKSLTTFPNSVTGFKHLKFLNLSFTLIEELPGFIIKLGNLQTLDVNSCENLKSLPMYVAGLANLRIFYFKDCPLVEELPEDFGALNQLRSLDLGGTGIKVLPDSCSNLHNLEVMKLSHCELPRDVKNFTKLKKFSYMVPEKPAILEGVGKLVFLRYLVYRVPEKIRNDAEYNVGIEELENLNFLECLDIWNLENVKDPIDAERANLKGKQNLHALFLGWAKIVDNLQVLESLQPPPGLKTLGMTSFMGSDLPTWMGDPSSLPVLEFLTLKNCRGIMHLPASIGQLQRLKYLTLNEMSLKSLDVGGFPSLINLYLIDMFLLEELCFSHPYLQDLTIIGCKSLTDIPSFPRLTKLVLEKVDHKLLCSVGRSQTYLTKLWLKNIEELIYFPMNILQNNCNLQLLKIRNCIQFEGFDVNDDENDNDFSESHSGSLHILELSDCPVLKFLPDLLVWTSLQQLLIFNCRQVKKSLTYDLKSLSFLSYLYVDFIQRDEQRGDPSDIEDLINLMKK